MDLSNEDSEKALLIQLADRNVISDELLQTRFGFDPDIERSRLNRESRDRAAERMIPKSGPWHDPQFENALRKISLQLGIAAPSQVGLELDPKKSGEKNALELKQALTPPKMPPGSTSPSQDKLPKEAGEGRPQLSKDSEKRKDRTFSPRTGASLRLWATAAQEEIGGIINPILLEFFNKKNIRSLSNIENKQLEDLKTNILFQFNPYSNISEAEIVKQISEPIDHNLINNYYSWLKLISIDINRELTVDEIKQAKASFYDMVYNQSAK